MPEEAIRPRLQDANPLLPPPSVIFGSTPVLRVVREKLERIAETSIPVLVEGESGVGKEVIAKYLHESSSWSSGPFVKIHCPGLPASAVDGEVFGHIDRAVKGDGNARSAARGTLFFDEIAELHPMLQSKLLQMLQEDSCCRISPAGRALTVRIICATNRTLEQEIKNERFRRDLFYRLNGARVEVTPLRKRTVDIPVVADYLVELHNQQFNRRARPFSTSLLNVLTSYAWPGNVRELENMVRRYVLFGNEEAVRNELAAWVPETHEPEKRPEGPVGLKEMTRQAARNFEAELITKVLDANHWNRKQAARALKISYRALLYKLKDAGITAR
jgi:two-component system, NtrC family, response regulator AtoC